MYVFDDTVVLTAIADVRIKNVRNVLFGTQNCRPAVYWNCSGRCFSSFARTPATTKSYRCSVPRPGTFSRYLPRTLHRRTCRQRGDMFLGPFAESGRSARSPGHVVSGHEGTVVPVHREDRGRRARPALLFGQARVGVHSHRDREGPYKQNFFFYRCWHRIHFCPGTFFYEYYRHIAAGLSSTNLFTLYKCEYYNAIAHDTFVIVDDF